MNQSDKLAHSCCNVHPNNTTSCPSLTLSHPLSHSRAIMFRLPSGKLAITCAELEAGLDESKGTTTKLAPFDVFKHQQVVHRHLGVTEMTKLGQGGFGQVFKGRLQASSEQQPQYCAIKVLTAKRSMLADLERFWARAQQEILLLRHLRHPNILSYFGYRTVRHQLYHLPCVVFIKTEWLHFSLHQMITDNGEGPLPWATILGVARHIGAAVKYLHDRSLVHHDIKSMNIMVFTGPTEDHFKLIDFGLSKWYSEPIRECYVQGTSRGTEDYVPPEMAKCKETGREFNPFLADSYALGTTLARIWLGREQVQTAISEEGIYGLAKYVHRRFLQDGHADPVISKQMRAIHQLLEPFTPHRRLFVEEFMMAIDE